MLRNIFGFIIGAVCIFIYVLIIGFLIDITFQFKEIGSFFRGLTLAFMLSIGILWYRQLGKLLSEYELEIGYYISGAVSLILIVVFVLSQC